MVTEKISWPLAVESSCMTSSQETCGWGSFGSLFLPLIL